MHQREKAAKASDFPRFRKGTWLQAISCTKVRPKLIRSVSLAPGPLPAFSAVQIRAEHRDDHSILPEQAELHVGYVRELNREPASIFDASRTGVGWGAAESLRFSAIFGTSRTQGRRFSERAFAAIEGKQPAHIFLNRSAKKSIGANCRVPKDQIGFWLGTNRFQLCLNMVGSSSPPLAFQLFCSLVVLRRNHKWKKGLSYHSDGIMLLRFSDCTKVINLSYCFTNYDKLIIYFQNIKYKEDQ